MRDSGKVGEIVCVVELFLFVFISAIIVSCKCLATVYQHFALRHLLTREAVTPRKCLYCARLVNLRNLQNVLRNFEIAHALFANF